MSLHLKTDVPRQFVVAPSGVDVDFRKDLILFGKWSEREDSNLRPLVPQTSALTGLRYAPNRAKRPRSCSLLQATAQEGEDLRFVVPQPPFRGTETRLRAYPAHIAAFAVRSMNDLKFQRFAGELP